MSGTEAHHKRIVDRVWLALVALTLGGAWLGENADAGWAVTFFVAGVIAIKGRLVIDHFMELRDANTRLRRLMNLYFVVMPLAVIAVYLYGDMLARLTSIR
jgi:hypothetical protein